MWWRRIHFELLEMLGEGGQGRVYKALRRDRGGGPRQTVALKILHSKTAVDLWRQEFESLSRVRSPFCVQVLSFERHRGRPALVLDFVDGVSLAQLGSSYIIDGDEAREVVAQIELALKDLHRFGVIHGDLSPQNILVDVEGHVRVLDFGLANCNGERSRATPAFAAPERLRGARASAAGDLYSLGKIAAFLNLPPEDSRSYLAEKPSEREFRDLPLQQRVQTSLAAKVRAWQERQALSQNARTKTQNLAPRSSAPSRRRLRVAGTLLAGFLLANSVASQAVRVKPLGVLILRSRQWRYFSLNGLPIGYSPLTVPVPAGQNVELTWVSADGRGSLRLRLSDHEVRKLQDSDFSH